MKIRNHLFDTINSCFELHGAVTIDTPVFERRVGLTMITYTFMLKYINYFA